MSLSSIKTAKKNTLTSKIPQFLVLAILVILAVIMVFPSINMFSTALKSQAEVLKFPPKIIPEHIELSNVKKLFTTYQYGLWYRNSLWIGLVTVIGTVLSSSFVAFGFARYQAKGKQLLFAFLLGTMMLPYPVLMIPQFILFKQMNWMDSFLPITVPAFFGSAYMIFLIRQFFTSLSNELFDAARMDGCSEFRQWWSIALPLSGPVLSTVAIFSFIGSWNDLLGQVLYLSSTEKFTLTIGMTSMYASATRLVPWNLVMIAAILAVIPILLLFTFAQKYFVQSIAMTGVK
ncbi:sugar ABC transporter ATP-binding protein [Paenibacillus pectinilyticus]|uniref:Sugar ABC transporter ATP-binding protein n=1 Tax=Paenibacillus pectinilyticus TaxID=512399 RepID=A0A1C0ZXN0_9BACL|nr:carbohydrate ABC transporter permease [Paenibacillus pectinilyticus]OCT12886.1 sugar ABC transporter ATP-binding protein [Paenibacillus pectinilyticus]